MNSVGEDLNMLTLRYDNSLIFKSSATYASLPDMEDSAYAITADSEGNIYVAGCSDLGGGDSDLVIIKYNNAMDTVLKTITYDFPEGIPTGWRDEYPRDIVVDSQGNIYVAGAYGNETAEYFSWIVIKFDKDLTAQKIAIFQGPDSEADYVCKGVSVDKYGNITITGEYDAGSNGMDFLTMRCDSDFNVLAFHQYNGSASTTDVPQDIAQDSKGNSIVTGQSTAVGNNINFFTIKYLGAPGIGSVSPAEGIQGSTLDVTITGSNFWAGAVLTFGGSGITVNSYTVESLTQINANITLASDAAIGSRQVTVTNTDHTSCVGVEVFSVLEKFEPQVDRDGGLAADTGNVLVQGGAKGYANPAKGEQVIIHFKAAGPGTVTVKIFTLQGQIIRELTRYTDGSEDQLSWDCRNTDGSMVASGLYIAHVKGPGLEETKKIAVVK